VVESVQLTPPKQKKPNLAAALDAVELAGEASAGDARPTEPEAEAANPAAAKASGAKKTRRVFKRLEIESGTKLSVKALVQAAGGDKIKEKHRAGDRAAQRKARHTLLAGARYQARDTQASAGSVKRARDAEEDTAEEEDDWELLHMVDICRDAAEEDTAALHCNGAAMVRETAAPAAKESLDEEDQDWVFDYYVAGPEGGADQATLLSPPLSTTLSGPFQGSKPIYGNNSYLPRVCSLSSTTLLSTTRPLTPLLLTLGRASHLDRNTRC